MSQYSESRKLQLLSYPIVGVLAALGRRTDRPRGRGHFYSPFREEKTPSFEVNESRNVWMDWGTGTGGGVIDLVVALKGCTRSAAMDFLASLSPVSPDEVLREPAAAVRHEGGVAVNAVLPVTSRVLLSYAEGRRCIPRDILTMYCREVHYYHRDRPVSGYYGIGFPNNAGGWTVRTALDASPWSKMVAGASSHTSVSPDGTLCSRASSDSVAVFEGFMDFLSWLVLSGGPLPRTDVCVLNSCVNARGAMDYIGSHRRIDLWLDNDGAGDRCTELIASAFPGAADDRAVYRDFNDLNDCLVSMTVSGNRCGDAARE